MNTFRWRVYSISDGKYLLVGFPGHLAEDSLEAMKRARRMTGNEGAIRVEGRDGGKLVISDEFAALKQVAA